MTTRRDFSQSLLVFAALGPLGAPAPVVAAGQTRAATTSPYRYKLRYFRRSNHYSFWVRVFNANSTTDDVAVKLMLSLAPPQGPATQDAVLYSIPFKSRTVFSHISRLRHVMRKGTAERGTILHCWLVIGSEELNTRVWTLRV